MTKSAIKNQRIRGLRDDWHNLVGHVVEVWRLGVHILTGTVEQTAEDGSVLWIAAEGARTRKMFDKSSGFCMWFAKTGPIRSHSGTATEQGELDPPGKGLTEHY